MTDAPDAGTFDIADLFTGKIYPKDSVEVFLDEDTAYAIDKNAKAVTRALIEDDKDKLKELAEATEALVKKGAASRVVFHLTGVSRDDRKNILDKVLEEFPQQYNFLNQPVPNNAANDALANRRWAIHIERIERANGSVHVAPTPEDIAVFRGNAPDSAVQAIEEAIEALSEGSKSGFETLVQENGFLSQP